MTPNLNRNTAKASSGPRIRYKNRIRNRMNVTSSPFTCEFSIFVIEGLTSIFSICFTGSSSIGIM